MKTESLTMRLTSEDAELLKRLAEERACSRASVLTLALREFAKRHLTETKQLESPQ